METGMPSDGEEAGAPRVPPVPAKPTQAEQDEHYATCHAAYRSWCERCVKGRGRVSPHMIPPEGELPDIRRRLCLHGTRRIPSDDFGVQVQKDWVPGCERGAREERECQCFCLLCWMVARFGMETIVAEVRS